MYQLSKWNIITDTLSIFVFTVTAFGITCEMIRQSSSVTRCVNDVLILDHGLPYSIEGYKGNKRVMWTFLALTVLETLSTSWMFSLYVGNAFDSWWFTAMKMVRQIYRNISFIIFFLNIINCYVHEYLLRNCI